MKNLKTGRNIKKMGKYATRKIMYCKTEKKYLYFFMFKMKNFERKIRSCCFNPQTFL